uniref:Uncharacterized protein n=1 Tax=Arundo donax TaxID=35708 RepID=A0A0A8ZLV6_ARUDO
MPSSLCSLCDTGKKRRQVRKLRRSKLCSGAPWLPPCSMMFVSLKMAYAYAN